MPFTKHVHVYIASLLYTSMMSHHHDHSTLMLEAISIVDCPWLRHETVLR